MTDSPTSPPTFATVSALIDALGGSSTISRATGIGRSAVSEMKRKGSIKVSHWPKLIALAQSAGVAGVTSDTLMRMHQAEPVE
jgi:hypothetical protein